ncbi:uncharacterized [Tachysurus ichikawai]
MSIGSTWPKPGSSALLKEEKCYWLNLLALTQLDTLAQQFASWLLLWATFLRWVTRGCEERLLLQLLSETHLSSAAL